MKNPYLAGLINVVIPGAGMAYLGKWKDAIGYFLVTPLLLIIPKSVVRVLHLYNFFSESLIRDDVKLPYAFELLYTSFYLILITYMIWDAFTTPFRLAKDQSISKNPKLAITLNFISLGLGFIYLKSWWMAFIYYIWTSFWIYLIFLMNNLFLQASTEPVSEIFRISLSLILTMLVYWDISSSVYQETLKGNQNKTTFDSDKLLTSNPT